jgi:hypothetical protein
LNVDAREALAHVAPLLHLAAVLGAAEERLYAQRRAQPVHLPLSQTDGVRRNAHVVRAERAEHEVEVEPAVTEQRLQLHGAEVIFVVAARDDVDVEVARPRALAPVRAENRVLEDALVLHVEHVPVVDSFIDRSAEWSW